MFIQLRIDPRNYSVESILNPISKRNRDIPKLNVTARSFNK